MARVLVTDGDSRAALSVTRSLGRRGQRVYVSAPRRNSLAGTSRYCAGEVRQAALDDGPDALGRSLLAAIRDLQAEIVIGITDCTLTVLHELGDELRATILPPPAVEYFRASDKVRLFEDCRSMGIAVPPGLAVPGKELPDRVLLDGLGYPIVVRPGLSWRNAAGRWIRGSVTLVNSRDDLEQLLRMDEALQFPYLVQQRVAGEGCGIFVLARHGRPLCLFAHRRIREKPPWGGVSTLCESLQPPSDLLASVLAYLGAQKWSGLAMFEFKRSPASREAYLLEINARPWGSMALAEAAGVDFVGSWLSVNDFAQQETPQSPYACGLRLRWWWGDVDHFYLAERSAGRAPFTAMVWGLCKAMKSGPRAEAWDTFQKDDALPFGSETLAWLRGSGARAFGGERSLAVSQSR